jgi:hypothetical protein
MKATRFKEKKRLDIQNSELRVDQYTQKQCSSLLRLSKPGKDLACNCLIVLSYEDSLAWEACRKGGALIDVN